MTSFPVIILTGLSGSGKSTALRVFEDLGYFCVDGLPLNLFPELIRLCEDQTRRRYHGLVLGMDMRQSDFGEKWETELAKLKHSGKVSQILFFETKTTELMRRYATTRRPHPLESSEIGLEQAIRLERDRMSPVREVSDLVMDTTQFSIHDLRRHLQEKWSFIEGAGTGLKVHVMSFGFKYGPPTESDLLFDLRFLPNPYFIETLRPASGKDEVISEFVLGAEPGASFLDRLIDFLFYILPLYRSEGRFRLTIAFGCTGGRHRSVAVAEAVFKKLSQANYTVSIEHRHINRD